MTRVTLLYGEEALLVDYNKRVAEKLNKKSSASSSAGVTRGILQMMQDNITYDPASSYFDSPIGGLFDTKKHFYRLISSLLSDLGLVFNIKYPSPWEVISELRNQNIITESDSTEFKVCLSIANEIRLKTYFANNGQKELFSPLPQSPDPAEQSTEHPIFREFDEDTLVRLLTTSTDLHQRCHKFVLKYNQQGKVEATILKYQPVSRPLILERFYCRVQNFSKASKIRESIPEDSPEYAQCAGARGDDHLRKKEWKKAIECFEEALKCSQDPFHTLTFEEALKCSQDPFHTLTFYRNLVFCLLQIFQLEKAKIKLEEAIKLHEESYGKDFETVIWSQLMLERGHLSYKRDEMQSAIEYFENVEKMQERMTRCNDIHTVNLNILMAVTCSKLNETDRALKHIRRVLRLVHKLFGEHNLSSELPKIYKEAAYVYRKCGRYHEASSMLERSLKLATTLYGNTAHPGKIVNQSEFRT